ncbi:MAG: adenylate/guanylate cyclase domain-containing protein [Pirellulaceae bacterium]
MSSSTRASIETSGNRSYGATLSIVVAGEVVFTAELSRPMELGRQRLDEVGPYSLVKLDKSDRVVIAALGEATISRRHVSLEPLSPQRIRVQNLSSVNDLWIDSAKPLVPEAACELKLPVFLTLSNVDLTIRVYASPDQDDVLRSLADPTAMPGAGLPRENASFDEVIRADRAAGDSRLLVVWLRNTMAVFQSAASSPDFLTKAAEAVSEIVGLDHAAVLTWRDGRWDVDASRHKDSSVSHAEWAPSRSLLERVRQQKRTFWKTPLGEASVRDQASVLNLEAYVAAPILSPAGDVIGALYGERQARGSSPGVSPITELEAMLVEVLSCSVAAGLARLQQEQAALEARVLFEQFFTPELSRQLQADPALLLGKDAHVTLLFCDIRGFSRISERVGARITFDWINSVMGALSDCVIQHQGVLVDYIGDELIAMWGAPEELPDHGLHACQAALAMLEKMPALSAQWSPVLGEPTSYTIGINTGPARVGNTGSKRKFKYGPLGNTVNLASRVQGTTKYVRTSLVITGATAEQIGDEFPKRRLGSVEVVNIAEPIVLYELRTTADARWSDLRARYESALAAYEQAEFHTATRILGNLLTDYPDDGPTVILLSRAVEMLASPHEPFSPVWRLTGK